MKFTAHNLEREAAKKEREQKEFERKALACQGDRVRAARRERRRRRPAAAAAAWRGGPPATCTRA